MSQPNLPLWLTSLDLSFLTGCTWPHCGSRYLPWGRVVQLDCLLEGLVRDCLAPNIPVYLLVARFVVRLVLAIFFVKIHPPPCGSKRGAAGSGSLPCRLPYSVPSSTTFPSRSRHLYPEKSTLVYRPQVPFGSVLVVPVAFFATEKAKSGSTTTLILLRVQSVLAEPHSSDLHGGG
jgi:hypothetical protein